MSQGRMYGTVGNSSAAQSSTLPIFGLVTTATPVTRPSIYDIIIGSDATPADNASRFNFQRQTTSGTATAITPQAIDPADPAAQALGYQQSTVGGTLTASAFLLTIALNQRASFRWVAAPGSELRIPATSGSGLGILPQVNTANYNCAFTLLHNE